MKFPSIPSSKIVSDVCLLALALVFPLLVTTASAQILVSPTPSVVAGSTSINPDNKSPLGFYSSSDSTLLSNLKSQSTFAALQDFTGFTGNVANNKSYIVDFSSTADLRFTYGPSNTGGSSTSISNNTGFATSASSNSLRLQGSTASTAFSFTISLGTWNGSTFANDQTAQGVGFTLTGNYDNLLSDMATVTFYSNSATALSTQTYSAAANGRAAFVGYLNTTGNVANDVAYVTISFTDDATANSHLLGLDDFGFTAATVPEPSVALLTICGAGAMFIVLRRRRP